MFNDILSTDGSSFRKMDLLYRKKINKSEYDYGVKFPISKFVNLWCVEHVDHLSSHGLTIYLFIFSLSGAIPRELFRLISRLARTSGIFKGCVVIHLTTRYSLHSKLQNPPPLLSIPFFIYTQEREKERDITTTRITTSLLVL